MKKLLSLILVLTLTLVLGACRGDKTDTKEQDLADVTAAIEELSLGNLTAVIENFTLPTTATNGVNYTYTSSNAAILSVTTSGARTAQITRPAAGAANVTLTLSVTANRGAQTKTKVFDVTVLAIPNSAQGVIDEAQSVLAIASLENLGAVTASTFNLRTRSTIHSTVTIVWTAIPKSGLTAPGEDASAADKAYYESYNEGAVTIAAENTANVQIVTVNRAFADQNVRLRATLTLTQGTETVTIDKDFELVVVKVPTTDAGRVAEAKGDLRVFGLDRLIANTTLPTFGSYGSTITWASNDTAVIAIQGGQAIISRPVRHQVVTLTATITVGQESLTKTFNAIVLGTSSVYTYRTSIAVTTNVNPHNETLQNARTIYELITAGLFIGDYDWAGSDRVVGDFANTDELLYHMRPNLASELPTDVNGDGKVWTVSLRDDITWQDGTVIDASTYIYSYKMLLDPLLLNARSAVLYSDLPVVNAEAYLKQGTYRGCNVSYKAVAAKDAVAAVDAVGVEGDANYVPAVPAQDAVEAKDAEVRLVRTITAANCAADKVVAETEISRTPVNFAANMNFSEVGIKALDAHTLEFTLTSGVTEWDFLTQFLSGITGPVHEGLYEAGMNSNRTGTNYGSTINRIMSYGPFKLTAWEEDVVFLLEKNPTFFDVDAWSFDYIRFNILTEQTAIVNQFKAGNLDVAGVGGTFFPEFKENPNLKFTPTTQTFRWATNIGERTDDKTNPMMQFKDFRLAIYHAVNREEMASGVAAPSIANQGLLSPDYIIYRTDTVSYRSTEQANGVFEGKSPETTGYNPVLAKTLFESAYAEAVAEGVIVDGSKVWIELTMLDVERNWESNNWVKENIEASLQAGAGQVNANKFEFRIAAFATEALNTQLDNNNFDIVFYAWSGVKFDPIALMGWVWNENFSYMNESGWEPGAWEITVHIPNFSKSELPVTKTYNEWFEATQSGGELYDDYEGKIEDLLNIAAAMEKALLDEVVAIPLYSAVQSAVYTSRVVFDADSYHAWMGWGGYRYMSLNTPDN